MSSSLPCLLCRFRPLFVVVLMAPVLSGCSGREPVSDPPAVTLRSYGELIDEFARLEDIARLDGRPVRLRSSADPADKNEDYNHFPGEGPAGWNLLADLQGPGYIARFWFTGAANDHRLKFFFDDEESPRIDTTLGEFFGGREPFLSPLAAREQPCWYSLAPIPYAGRLRILSEVGEHPREGWPRHFYQISEVRLPPEQAVESFPRELDEDTTRRLVSLRKALAQSGTQPPPAGTRRLSETAAVPPGKTVWYQEVPGPATLRALRLTPDFVGAARPTQIDAWLRETRLLVRYNGSSKMSVNVPIGDFFGSVPRPTRFLSAYIGMEENTFVCRFPMPFAEACRVGLANDGASAFEVAYEAHVQDGSPGPVSGYLHAVWTRSGPDQVGRPHPVVRTEGRGRLAGCLLTVTSGDESWWALESDESIRIDGAAAPQWKGTGLEDYFTSGWYYYNVMARPLHGILFRAPYRTVQYRFHPHESIRFEKDLEMTFERGPDHESKAWMESVGYYYLDEPDAVASPKMPAASRAPAPDRYRATTVMTELLNLERLGDYRGAGHAVETVLESMRGLPGSEELKVRRLAYREAVEGFEAVKPAYQALLATTTNAAARAQVNDLLWFHESPHNALLGAYCSMPTRVYLDGRPLFRYGDHQRLYVHRITLDPGGHVLALQADAQAYPDWVQLYLRTHHGDVGTQPDWRFSTSPEGRWQYGDFDDSGWETMGKLGVKGPPEKPYLYVAPNGYVNMQSLAGGLRPVGDTRQDEGSFVFRKVFSLPPTE